VLAVMLLESKVLPSVIVSSVAESDPPVGGRSPVSEKIWAAG